MWHISEYGRRIEGFIKILLPDCDEFNFLEPNAATNLRTTTVTESKLTVEWTAPVNGVVKEYELQLKSKAVNTNTVTRTTTSATFEGLTAGTKYTVVVISKSGVQRSRALDEDFYTSKCVSFRSII